VPTTHSSPCLGKIFSYSPLYPEAVSINRPVLQKSAYSPPSFFIRLPLLTKIPQSPLGASLLFFEYPFFFPHYKSELRPLAQGTPESEIGANAPSIFASPHASRCARGYPGLSKNFFLATLAMFLPKFSVYSTLTVVGFCSAVMHPLYFMSMMIGNTPFSYLHLIFSTSRMMTRWRSPYDSLFLAHFPGLLSRSEFDPPAPFRNPHGRTNQVDSFFLHDLFLSPWQCPIKHLAALDHDLFLRILLFHGSSYA